jgi:hypothetical protein
VGQLDPHHLVASALALAVDAVVQAEDPEAVLVDLTGEVAGEHRAELLDVGLHGGPQLGVELGPAPDLDRRRARHPGERTES